MGSSLFFRLWQQAGFALAAGSLFPTTSVLLTRTFADATLAVFGLATGWSLKELYPLLPHLQAPVQL